MKTGLLALLIFVLVGCRGVEAIDGTQVKMDFTRAGGLYDAPFPSDDLVRADGTIALSAFPNPKKVDLVGQGLNLLGKDARGFSTTGGVFFQLTGPLDPSVTTGTPAASNANMFLTSVEPGSTDFQRHLPVDVAFHDDGGPFGAPNLLSVLPLQGRPLLPRTRYVVVVLRKALDAQHKPLGVSLELAKLAAKIRPDGMSDEAFSRYQEAIDSLEMRGTSRTAIAGLAVFTTDDPTATLARVAAAALARPLPVPDPFTLTDVFDDYCAYASTVKMPVYQGGAPPYSTSGGRWVFDQDGNPVLQDELLANLVVTIPRGAPPPAGFPVAVFVRAGGGGERPLVDRGVQPMTGSPALVPGTGPALEFARAGFAGVSVDGPNGGRRNVNHGDEQVLMFNFFNAGALRDNIRQSALELVVLAHILEGLSLDASACPSVGAKASFDVKKLALMGHSTGAWIAPLALANEPRYRAAILSGAGASFIENVLYKKKPLEIRPFAEVLIGYADEQRTLIAEDPVLTLVQWAAEPADPQVYTRRIIEAPAPGEAPCHVLMLQGVVDHYILPRIANATSLSLGLDLAGDELDHPQMTGLMEQTALGDVLSWSGRSRVALPALDNHLGADGAKATAVVVQHPEDGVEDGHEVVFQTEAPKREYRCFLQSFASGAPRVPAPSSAAACQ